MALEKTLTNSLNLGDSIAVQDGTYVLITETPPIPNNLHISNKYEPQEYITSLTGIILIGYLSHKFISKIL